MKHTFKLSSEENKNKGHKIKTDYSLIIMISCIIFALICIIVSIVMATSSKRVNNNVTPRIDSTVPNVSKEDNTKDYVYTIEKKENMTQEETYDEIPYINIATDEIAAINKEIKEKYLLVSKKAEYGYSYQYSLGNDILSLLIEYIYSPSENTYPVSFYKSYNIDIKTGKVLSPSNVLSRYGITADELKMFIASKFKSYYEDVVKKGYYDKKTCDYNCFLSNRGITEDYLKGACIYVDNGKLTVYKFFYKNSDYNDGEYFDNISYQIVVKE